MANGREMLGILNGNCSECYLRLRKYKEAEEFAIKSLEYDTGNIKYIFRLGKALRGQGRLKNALEEFRRGLVIQPNNP